MSERLVVFGHAYVIEETLTDPWRLDVLRSSSIRDEFRIDHIEEWKPINAREEKLLTSTSLFSTIDRTWDEPWTYEGFAKAVKGPAEKYWLPLHDRRERFPGYRNRVYLDPNLINMAKPLLEVCGFDEVVVMALRSEGYKSGMLWRYLPIQEEQWRWVACTGIDGYDATGAYDRELCDPHESFTAAVWMNRHWLPFAGPFACRPLWVREKYKVGADVAQSLSGFLNIWETPNRLPNQFLSEMIRSTHQAEKALPWIDACFLMMAFWNSWAMESNPWLTSQVYYRFAATKVVPFMLGHPHP